LGSNQLLQSLWLKKYIYLYRITLTVSQKDHFYFGIRTCKGLPKNDIDYYGSPITNKHLWDIATYKKKDILRFLPFSKENYQTLGQKETILIKKAKDMYGIYDENIEGQPIGGRCLNVNVTPVIFMTEMVRRKIGIKNSIAQKGIKNSQYGTCVVNHPLIKGTKRIKGELLPEYLDQGWLLGAKGYRIPPMTNRDLFPKNIKKRMEYTETYNKLFKEFIDGEYKSISDFINKTGYDYSFQNIRMLWKKYIPDFNQLYVDCKGQATKPFTSKDAREWISRNRKEY
jgi:hypothetical protein